VTSDGGKQKPTTFKVLACRCERRQEPTAVQHVMYFGRPRLWYKVERNSDEEAPVELALRLNVLAVCAAFAFVGAILLGAF
jgi:hypothetical protein